MKRAALVAALGLAVPQGCIGLDFMWFYPERLDAYTHEWSPGEGDEGEPHEPNHIPAECVEEVALETADGLTVYGLWAWRDEAWLAGDTGQPCGARPAKHTFHYSHGQSRHLDYYWDRQQLLWDAGFNVFAVDYRGYGRSEGDPTEEGMYEDSRTALRHLRCRLAGVDPCEPDVPLPSARGSRIFYYGYSLGAAAATQMAREVEPSGLVLEAPFASAQAFVDDVVQIGLPASALLEYAFDNYGRLPLIAAPKLIVHGTDDDYVGFHHSQVLYEAAVPCEQGNPEDPDCKDLWAVAGAGHGDIPEVAGVQDYLERLRGFAEAWAP